MICCPRCRYYVLERMALAHRHPGTGDRFKDIITKAHGRCLNIDRTETRSTVPIAPMSVGHKCTNCCPNNEDNMYHHKTNRFPHPKSPEQQIQGDFHFPHKSSPMKGHCTYSTAINLRAGCRVVVACSQQPLDKTALFILHFRPHEMSYLSQWMHGLISAANPTLT